MKNTRTLRTKHSHVCIQIRITLLLKYKRVYLLSCDFFLQQSQFMNAMEQLTLIICHAV